MINFPDNYILLSADKDEIAKNTVRKLYDLACIEDGWEGTEKPIEMFERARLFVHQIFAELIQLSRDCDVQTVEGSVRTQLIAKSIIEMVLVKEHLEQLYLPYTKKKWAELDN